MSEQNTTQGPEDQAPSSIADLIGSTIPAAAEGEFDFQKAVKDRVREKAGRVRENVVESYVEKELKRYEDAVLKSLVDLEAAKLEVKKIKPTFETFDADGNSNGGSFSKEDANKIREAKLKVSKIEAAIKAALTNNDYSKVLNLNK